MIILLLAGAFFLIIGVMMIVAPDGLYSFNEHMIKLLCNLNHFLNNIFLTFTTYLNKTFVHSKGVRSYRRAIAASSILLGLLILYASYYYSEHAMLPPPIRHFLIDMLNRFTHTVEGVSGLTPSSS